MKLRITHEGRTFEVEAELIEGPVPAALAGLFSPAAAATTADSARERGFVDLIGPEPLPTPPELVPKPVEPKDLPSPIEGSITAVHVKPGDIVRTSTPIATIEVSHTIAPAKMPFVGQLRSDTAGTIRQVHVKVGDAVKIGQPIVRVG
ncbi:MAG: biotin/lipoyl-containing protein [Planctomycetota bacterium]|nr:biotin/lipoyl-containing protein [Planctomycetota bacterium]